MKKLLLVSMLGMASLAPTAEFAHANTTGESCRGSACADVSVVFSGGCYRITNHGDRRIRVQMGAIPFGLERGQTHILTNPFGGGCLANFAGGVSANYT